MPGREVSLYETNRMSLDTRRAVQDIEEWEHGQELVTESHYRSQRLRLRGLMALAANEIVPGMTSLHDQISQAVHEKPVLEAVLRTFELDVMDDCAAIARDFVAGTDFLDGDRRCLR